MTYPVDHIHNLDSYITNEGEAFESVAGTDNVLMDLWVPSERVTLHLIDIPTAPPQVAELIPWMLEDRSLQGVDESALCYLRDYRRGSASGLCRQSSRLKRVAAGGAKCWRSAQSMLPDYLALPWEPERISVGWRDGVCLVRYGVAQGFAASPDMAWAMIDTGWANRMPARLSISIPQAEWVRRTSARAGRYQ